LEDELEMHNSVQILNVKASAIKMYNLAPDTIIGSMQQFAMSTAFDRFFVPRLNGAATQPHFKRVKPELLG
jgi:hypothetical protein